VLTASGAILVPVTLDITSSIAVARPC